MDHFTDLLTFFLVALSQNIAIYSLSYLCYWNFLLNYIIILKFFLACLKKLSMVN